MSVDILSKKLICVHSWHAEKCIKCGISIFTDPDAYAAKIVRQMEPYEWERNKAILGSAILSGQEVSELACAIYRVLNEKVSSISGGGPT